MQKASLKGIVIGSITDIAFSYATLIPLAIYFIAASGLGARTDHGTSSAGMLMENAWFVVWGWTFGSIGSVLGGYVAARISKRDEVLNGTLSSILCVSSALYAFISGTAAGYRWSYLACLLLSPALGALGGLLRSRQIAPQG